MRYHNRLIICIVLFFILCAVGSGFLFYQFLINQKKHTLGHLQTIVAELDSIISNAKIAGDRATGLLNGQCSKKVQTEIRKLVATIPDVTTINLLHGKHLYCSSIFGGVKFASDAHSPPAKSLFLMSDNSVKPSKSLLVYHALRGESSVMVGLDNYYVQNELKKYRESYSYIMTVNGVSLDANGNIFTNLLPEDQITYSSTQFKYSVSALPLAPLDFVTFWQNEHDRLLITFLIPGVFSVLFFKYLIHRQSMFFMLREAIDNNQLKPFIQPIVEARSGNIVAGEILMRWQHPKWGNISPDRFIPLAEKNGLISRITELGIQSVIRSFESLDLKSLPLTTLFFNVSAADFTDHGLLNACHSFRDKTVDTALRIGLEITERVAIEDSEFVREICQQLDMLGVTLSADDFGTGHCNYKLLMQLRPRYIKIDKHFTQEIETDEGKEAIVRNIIAIAKDRGCLTIAEGVESASQREKLVAMGVSFLQGYFFSRPIEAAVFFDKLQHSTL
ncbi:EAL domain-containing protein [Enterobacter sp. RHBSTW-00175]|uniref:EAL domain-containing protein n=1 Tax=Enterobacter sp. RHBSTW-00175 TaxID=2742639 RepID=UPI0015EA8BEE|nr:EAL domain-containing protein [Enterobacter sp. RHBSTW-00175]QMR78679.1 EAL domain-containing protein [Enterobacter sp. RHBSTW-00175]HDR2751506.1 EAL domain-containing protein [Enterobacter asburiae]